MERIHSQDSAQRAWGAWLNAVQLDEAKAISRQCQSSGIPVVFLKGTQLLTEVYKRTTDRSMNDIDILITEKDKAKLHQLLVERGYREDAVLRWSASAHKADYFKKNNE